LRASFFILLLVLLLPLTVEAYDLLVLQSRRDPAYDEALSGFRTVRKGTERVISLANYTDVDIIRIVREDHPRLVLAMGDSALAVARKIPNTPVVALMALGIHTPNRDHPNLTGIGMYIPPDRYTPLFKGMNVRRVGVIHNPSRSGWYLQLARHAAQQAGIELVVREVTDPREVLPRLTTLAGKVDALWMIPDTTAVTRETTEAFLRFAQEQQIPAISFAGAYLGLGAAAALELDRGDLGRQAGEMAAALLAGSTTADIPLCSPRVSILKLNRNVLKRLSIPTEPLENLSMTRRARP
jgi:putative ABC transport system substrate-binding protein